MIYGPRVVVYAVMTLQGGRFRRSTLRAPSCSFLLFAALKNYTTDCAFLEARKDE
jgi:hypothetical protein